MNIFTTHFCARYSAGAFFFLLTFCAFGQNATPTSVEVLRKIGTLLDQNKIAATNHEPQTDQWVWRFVFVEENHTSLATPESLAQLTRFEFQYNARTRTRKGHILNAKTPTDDAQALHLIYRQLEQNLRDAHKMPVIRANGHLYYIARFVSESRRI